MEVYILCIVVGFLLAASFVMIGVVIAHASEGNTKDCSKCSTECKCNNNNILCDGGDNMHDCNMGNIHEPVNSGQDMGLEDKAERAIIRLNTLRTGSTRSEQEAIDFAIECIEVRVRLEKFFKERGV